MIPLLFPLTTPSSRGKGINYQQSHPLHHQTSRNLGEHRLTQYTRGLIQIITEPNQPLTALHSPPSQIQPNVPPTHPQVPKYPPHLPEHPKPSIPEAPPHPSIQSHSATHNLPHSDPPPAYNLTLLFVTSPEHISPFHRYIATFPPPKNIQCTHSLKHP